MAIVLAINGIVESYPVKAAGARPARIESPEAQREKASPDRSQQAAQTAYEQQTRQEHSPKPALLARDLMSTPVVTLSSDSTLAEAWTLMRRRSFRHIPVSSVHGALVGMVSDRDLLRHAPELILAARAHPSAHRRLADIMTQRVISATPLTEIRDIARVMLDERIHAVPVIDSARRLIGILTARDLLRGIATHGPLELWT
jgi:acetoin utilization protein AcuB